VGVGEGKAVCRLAIASSSALPFCLSSIYRLYAFIAFGW
jgi:hypothetical protein